jgi:hypothetical protein
MTVSNRPDTMNPEAPEARVTVIPTPRSNSLFAGWGVKF